MLPKKRRTKRSDFANPSGFFYKSDLFNIRVKRALKPENETVFGVFVTTKTAKKAVDRNFARRRVYEAINTFMKDVSPGFVVFIRVNKNLSKVDFKDIVKNIKNLFVLAKIL